MITDVATYLRFFDGVARRTARDVAALPPEAGAWRLQGWPVPDIFNRSAEHIAALRAEQLARHQPHADRSSTMPRD